MAALLVILVLFGAPLFAQQQDGELREVVAQELKKELNFRNPRAPMLKLVFKTEGTGVKPDGTKVVEYSISVSGLGPGKTYTLSSWEVGAKDPVVVCRGIRVDEKGMLRCDGSDSACPRTNDEFRIAMGGMIGLPRRFILAENDVKPIAIGEAVPFPAIGRDEECSAEAVLLFPNAAATVVFGKGFLPNEEVKMLSLCCGETLENVRRVGESGEVQLVILPFVKGYNEGRTTITFHASKCHPTTAFNWGVNRAERIAPAPVWTVDPVYPAAARLARIQGQVVFRATIDKNGAVKELAALNGHPLLVPAALEAVKQWRFEPYRPAGVPVEFETQLTVNFNLSDSTGQR